jgi:predicted DNA binding protein
MSDQDDERAASPLEVEFTLRDEAYPFVGVSEREDCAFELAEMLPRGEGRYAEFFNVAGASPQRIEALAAAHGTVEATHLTTYRDGDLFEFVVSDHCPAFRLAELGALPRTVRGVDGVGTIVAEIPSRYDHAAIVETFLEEHSDAELASKRETDAITPPLSEPAFRQVLRTHLTDRQLEVVRTAFEAGYYEWPRECTGEEVAEELGISSATFSEHVHAAERKLLTALIDGFDSTDSDR